MANFSETLIPLDKNIAVLCGGMSSEREVSLRSGKNCFAALKRLGYENTVMIDVDKDIVKNLQDNKIDVAYLALHGKYGEDGCIQGLLEILGIPYTGCGVMASAISMNKEYTKKVLKDFDIPLIQSITVDETATIEYITKKVSYPLMVKPVCEGSSIGMAKVTNNAELEVALKDAFSYNSSVMLEEYIVGESMTVGVLDANGKTFATPILGFRTKTEWYDFEAKYTEGMTEFILPAQISAEMTEEIQEIAVQSHKAVGATGMSRVDFLLDKETNIPYVLEINTIPGMTDLSDLPAQSKEMGIDYDNLVKIILNSALLPKN